MKRFALMAALVAATALGGECRVGNARFTLLTERMVRCEWSPAGMFEDCPSLVFVNRETAPVDFKCERCGDGVVVKTSRMTLEWTGGAFNSTNLIVNGVAALAEDTENLLGTQRTLDRKTCLADTLATMEKGLLSRRGVTVVDDTATPLFVDSPSRWGKWVVERHASQDYRDITVFAYGHDYKGCLGDYVKVAGRIPLPPRWAFGYWWSRYWLYTDREVRELVSQMKSVGVPLDVFILDMEWHETWDIGAREDLRDEAGQLWGWTGYTWNRRLFPDPSKTIRFLHDSGCKVALNLHPANGIQTVEDCYRAFARDYGWNGTNSIPFHADEEKWATCYFKDAIGPLEDDGVDFWWLDWQQWLMSKDKPSLNVTFWLNHLFAAHAADRGLRPFIYHRWGGLGSHRYQVGFSGDTKVSWAMLEAIPWFTATAANVGYGYWGHDIGGNCHPDGSDGLDGELFTRWLQSAVFTPIFKTHSSKSPLIERRIWKYPEHFFALREAMRLRYRLVPYIYTAAREAYDTGVAICRPMYYDWPEEAAAYAVTNAYMFGNDILAATISRPMDKASGVSTLDLWLPPGKWYDVSTGELLEGGRMLRREYAIDDNPWFVKAGAIIPMYPDSVDNLGNVDTDDLVLFCAPGEEYGECEVYEDDGDNADYATNFRRTHVVREGNRVTIAPRKGAYTLKFPCLAAPVAVRVNGAQCNWEYDAGELAVVVKTPLQDGTRTTVVELDLPGDAKATAARLYGLKGVFRRIDAVTEELKVAMKSWHSARNLPDSWQTFWQTRAMIADSPERLAEHLRSREEAGAKFAAELDTLQAKFPPSLVERLRAVLPARRTAIPVPPQCFDAGGWRLDAQFMAEMGSPYLLAHGLGVKVADAVAMVDVPEAGDWRIWVRTRNWAPGAPGLFAVVVDGRRLEKKFGAGSSEWSWEDGGLVHLERGKVEIALCDLTGFDGRCAGLVLAKDGERPPDGALSPEALPVEERIETDLVVVGGGVPGACAAVAAARRGMKVALLHDRPVLGGNASSEIRVWCAGEARHPIVRELRGVFMNRASASERSDAMRMAVVGREANIVLRLSTRAFGVEKNGDGSIAAVKALDLKRNRVVSFVAPLFVDATGDGWIGFWAGADFRTGRESKDEYAEPSAPDSSDADTLGASIMWESTEANAPVPFTAPWAESYAQGVVALNGEWNWEYGIHRDMTGDGEAIRDRLLLAIYGAFSLAKRNHENANRVLSFCPFLIGKRESRRLLGDLVLSETDIIGRRQFEDAIATGSWSVDLHYEDDSSEADFLTKCVQPHYGRYWISYRCIYSRNVPNLFMSGRCFSATHAGLGSARVICTLAQLGVAAGEAAALCRELHVSPREVYSHGHIRMLQDRIGGDWPDRCAPERALWHIVDDESPNVAFGKGWMKSWCPNGGQEGDAAHFPGVVGEGSGAVPVIDLAAASPVVYPLPVYEDGLYAIRFKAPYLWWAKSGSRTVLEIVSGGDVSEICIDQGLATGLWHEMGEFRLAKGAQLRLIPAKSQGTVVADAFAVERLIEAEKGRKNR